MAFIFISYRRKESFEDAKSIYRSLESEFESHNVFLDVNSIRGGEDWDKTIRNEIESCQVLIVIIGPNWVGDRIFDKEDYVRMEVRTALENNAFIIPLLVQNTKVPIKDDIPSDIVKLLNYQFVAFDPNNSHDVKSLIDAVRQRKMGIGPSQIIVYREKQRSKLSVSCTITIDENTTMYVAPSGRDYAIVPSGEYTISARYYHFSYQRGFQGGTFNSIDMKSDPVTIYLRPNEKVTFFCGIETTRKFFGIPLQSKLMLKEESRIIETD